ncbi:MAG: phosphatidate cytidylyltransferase [Pseudomonadota bacterium]
MGGQPRSRVGEFALRVASALVLIPFGLFVVFQGGALLSLAAAAFAAIMAFEWCRMAGQQPIWLACIAVAAANLAFVFANTAVVSCALGVAAIAFGAMHRHEFTRAAFGILYAGGLPFALQVLRMGGPWDGQIIALILMGIVWTSDTGAYFAGRGFGGPSLSPDSPNKTWSGAIGGIVCGMLSGALAAGLAGGDLFSWIAMGAGVSLVAQLGDLFESQIKRTFGVKDASNLVPGHGGVMDRVDGLGAVCVLGVAAFLAWPSLADVLGV